MAQRKRVYVHQDTGNIIKATPGQAKFLSPNYKRVTYGVNEDGERTMTLPLRGATATIIEQEKEVEAEDGDTATE